MMIRTLIKILLIFGAILSFYIFGNLLRFFFRNPKIWVPLVSKLCQFHTWIALKLMKVSVIKKDFHSEMVSKGASHLIVCNHLSYLDILIMMAIKPWAYVTSVEIRDTFLLGDLCKLFGCVFIERRNRDNIQNEIAVIAQALKSGTSVCFFPEATSTNGEQVLDFKKSFFTSAIDAGVPVQLLSIRYFNKTNKNLNPHERDSICWYGDMGFLSHLIRCVQLDGFVAELSFVDCLDSSKFLRDDLAKLAHDKIEASYFS